MTEAFDGGGIDSTQWRIFINVAAELKLQADVQLHLDFEVGFLGPQSNKRLSNKP